MYRILELFSGIGSQAKALKNIGCEIINVGTCDWDIHAMVAYDAIHNSSVVPFSVLKIPKEVIFDELSRKTLSNATTMWILRALKGKKFRKMLI